MATDKPDDIDEAVTFPASDPSDVTVPPADVKITYVSSSDNTITAPFDLSSTGDSLTISEPSYVPFMIQASPDVEPSMVVQNDGSVMLRGMNEDLSDAIRALQERMDKLEKFYVRMTGEAQRVTEVAEQVENPEDWTERIYQIAKEVGLADDGSDNV